MNEKRYSQAQVLCGLREAWKDFTFGQPSFDAETRIYTFMQADGTWDELDLADVFLRLEKFFGFRCSDEEWSEFLGVEIAQRSPDEWKQDVVPRLTFGSLAKFIADRAPVVASFEPIPVLGSECATAGVFTGILKVAEKVKRQCHRFAPSSHIIEVMRGRDLDRFWVQLRWLTEQSLPELPGFWTKVTTYAGLIAALVMVVGLIILPLTGSLNWFMSLYLGAVVLCLMATSYKYLINPLPAHLVSFRDLSIFIVESRKRTTLATTG